MSQVVLLSKDLFFVPSFRSAATAAGLELKVLSSWDAQALGENPAESVAAFVLDLSAISLADLSGLSAAMAEAAPAAVRCAFGPHVQRARLEAAAAAGFESVLSRGQLNQSLPSLLQGWSERLPFEQ